MNSTFYENNIELLLRDFNLKNPEAYSFVYSSCYSRLMYYVNKLSNNSEVNSCDLIQNVFLKLLENNHLFFDSYEQLLSYLYVSIKNSYINYLSHNHIAVRYIEQVNKEYCNNQYLDTGVIEAETIALIYSEIELLPEMCANVLKLYIEGWQLAEIAEKLHISVAKTFRLKEKGISFFKRNS